MYVERRTQDKSQGSKLKEGAGERAFSPSLRVVEMPSLYNFTESLPTSLVVAGACQLL